MTLTVSERRTIAQRLLRILVRLMPALDPERIDQTWPAVLPAIERAVASEHATVAQQAATAYMLARTAQAPADVFASAFTATPVGLTAEALERIRTSLTVVGPVRMKAAIGRGESTVRASKLALVGMQGAATRHVLGAARDTTLRAVADDPVTTGWARLPRANACPFCLLLAVRGGAYRSKETALATTSRSARGAGQTYHDACQCSVTPIFNELWTPPAHIARAEELYKTSTVGKSGAAARRAFAEAIAADRETPATLTARAA